jgi:hypothetical protein
MLNYYYQVVIVSNSRNEDIPHLLTPRDGYRIPIYISVIR